MHGIIPKDYSLRTPRSHSSIFIQENINLIYLRRTLVEDLAKAPEKFDG